MTNRLFRLLIFGVTLAAGIYLFSDQLSASGSTTSPSATYGGTLIVGITSDVDSFNPLFGETSSAQEITHMFLLGLADLNDKSEFTPELAHSWKSSDDYLQLTYYLRKDAIWSDGTPLTAADVKFTWDLLMDETVASPRQGVTEYVKRVVVVDPYTIRFEFTKAYPNQMFDTAGEILPKHILEGVDRSSLRSHEFGRKPISSGPFVLTKWVSQQYIEIAPNENYFGGRPFLDRVIFKIIPDVTNLLLQLQSGEIDMMVGLPPESVEQLKAANPGIAIYPVSGRVYYYLGYNLKHPLFKSAKVRQALTMAIDRQGIIDALLNGTGSMCVGPLPPMIAWAFDQDAKELPFDVKQAKQTLAETGWRDENGDGWLDKDGQTFEFTVKTNAGNQLRSDVAVVIQNQLKRIGVKMRIETIERSALLQDLRAQKFEAVMGGWSTAFNVDPTPIFHSSATNMFNFGAYSNPQVDKLIELGREEMDQEKAAGIWKKMQQVIYQDQPYTFLFWKDRLVAVDRQFKNVNPIALSTFYDLEKWYRSLD